MQSSDVQELLSRVGAVITQSHIVYTSGKHGSAYINKDAVYPHTQLTSDLCRLIAHRFKNDSVEVVIAPVTGGIILSQWVAHHLSQITGREVLAVYAEKEGTEFVIKRGYEALVGSRRVLVVEDVLNTGGSAKKVVELARLCGGTVIGLGALCNRGKVQKSDLANVPELYTLMDVELEAWDAETCPLCQNKIQINLKVGKGREFMARIRQ